jgi:succinyl-CoA synthetase beta subunit
MKLYECQARDIFSKYGIPALPFYLIRKPEEIREVIKPIVLKAQVLVGGRGKAGGIKFASNRKDAINEAQKIFNMRIKGEEIKEILVIPEAKILKEYYLGYTIDREKGCLTLIGSSEGGVDIEEVAEKNPEKIAKLSIDPFLGLRPYQARELANSIGLRGVAMINFASIAYKLYKIVKDMDAELCEINPLALTPDGLLALDAKLTIDDNSTFRHKEYKPTMELKPLERKAREYGLAYVDLKGDIGIIGCGAGLVMASLDTVKLFGGEPANFLDVGGGANTENMKQALEVISMRGGMKSVFINIFGGITRCDEIAQGIVEFNPKIPLSIRMMGTHEEKGKRILEENGYYVFGSMEEAAKKSIELAKKS